MQIIGHRGARGIAPENSLAGFARAIELGVDYIELDIHATKDGVLMVAHDKSLFRLARQFKRIKNMTYSEIQDVRTISGEIIPTLDETLSLIGARTKVNIEIKADKCAPQLVEKIRSLIDRGYDYDHFLVSSFSLEILKEIQDLDNHIKLGLLHRISPYTFIKAAKRVRLSAVGFWQYTAIKHAVSLAHDNGLMVYAHTTNRPDRVSRLEGIGVDAIVTDYPDRFLKDK